MTLSVMHWFSDIQQKTALQGERGEPGPVGPPGKQVSR